MQNYTKDNFSFAIIYGLLLNAEFDSAIKETDKVVFSKLLVRYRGSYANGDKYRDENGVFLYYTIEQMAADCNISESTAKRSLSNLAKSGYITKSKTGSKANRIYISNPVISEDVLLGVFKVSKIGTLAPAEDTQRTYYINDDAIVNDIGVLGMSSYVSDDSYCENYNSLFEDLSEVKMTCEEESNEVNLEHDNGSKVILTSNYYTNIKSSNNYSNTNNKYIPSSNTILNIKGLERTDLLSDNVPVMKPVKFFRHNVSENASMQNDTTNSTPTLLSNKSKAELIAEFKSKAEADFFTQCHIGEDGERRNHMAQYIVTICEKLMCATYPIAYKDMHLTSIDIHGLFEKVCYDYLEEVLNRVIDANMNHPFSYIRSTIIDVLMTGEAIFEPSLYNYKDATENLDMNSQRHDTQDVEESMEDVISKLLNA